MSALYVIGGALVGAALARLQVADLAFGWSLICGVAFIAAGAWIEMVGSTR